MSLVYNSTLNDSIGFDEFISNVNHKIKTDKKETVFDCNDDIIRLSNNKSFLVDLLNNELENIVEYSSNHLVSPYTFQLFRCEKFIFRINYFSHFKPLLPEMISTQIAHDHNYNFITSIYSGKGYDSEMWEYDYDSPTNPLIES